MSASETFDLDAPDAEAPLSAFLFDAPRVQFAAAGEEQSQTKPVELLARTGAPIEHWYWGRIVHDMDGMQTKPVVALDWCHGNELIGKADAFDVSTGDLVVRGSIESLEIGDIADQIIKRSGRGIPYEASIYFDPWTLVLEYLQDGFVTEVNGRQLEGPCVIVREWTLRRIALCPSGADGGTEARFTSTGQQAAKFALNWKGNPMAKTATTPAAPTSSTPATPAPAAAAQLTPAAPAADAPAGAQALAASAPTSPATPAADRPGDAAGKSEFEARFERFTTEFGAEAGTEYLRAGLSYEAALKADLDKTKLALKSAQSAAQTTEQKLAAVNLGEESAVDVGVASGQSADGKHTFASCMAAARQNSQKKPA